MRFFFIVAMGRSGTHFLSSLLASDPRAVVHHEPGRQDPQLHLLRHADPSNRALDASLEERFEPLLAAAAGKEIYGETNSYLRFQIDWLRQRFDPAFVHLIRDGRNYVRSAWTRPAYTPYEIEGPILPADDDSYAARWSEMDRFQRLCWSWLHTNAFIEARVDQRVRFEDLLRDYDVFRDRVLRPTGLQVDRETWEREVGRPRNTSVEYRLKNRLRRMLRGKAIMPEIAALPCWPEWSEERQSQFWEICGEMMERYGYTRELSSTPTDRG